MKTLVCVYGVLVPYSMIHKVGYCRHSCSDNCSCRKKKTLSGSCAKGTCRCYIDRLKFLNDIISEKLQGLYLVRTRIAPDYLIMGMPLTKDVFNPDIVNVCVETLSPVFKPFSSQPKFYLV